MSLYPVCGPFDRDAVVSYIRLTPERGTQVSLFATRDAKKGARHYVLHKHLMRGPEYEDGVLVSEGESLLLSTKMSLREGSSLWVEADEPVVVAYQAYAAQAVPRTPLDDAAGT